ncbi:MerR family transcriptional regulator [Faecalicoccus pleomorphus]|uniref:MerR family transcriptional regulator n=1 Tax=Faecalicoccus pleomorphus TaxID=1323 RepID=A0A7X9NGJ2_9FIRM|nr:MerR family transcriptional regulator [Faecalicoccus pleomorphus]NME43858.1 MerR family transcriptional regulator [Faecalicoccus pleomorphus]
MLKIKEFAQLCGCSIYTLRYYDEIDVLKPAYVDEKSGYRFYEEEQIKEFNQIKRFQEIGFSIGEFKALQGKEEEDILREIQSKIEHMKKMHIRQMN